MSLKHLLVATAAFVFLLALGALPGAPVAPSLPVSELEAHRVSLHGVKRGGGLPTISQEPAESVDAKVNRGKDKILAHSFGSRWVFPNGPKY